ncbi:hypothetical protein WMY93_033182 [Mugilogobius chulae]|uniref:Uncharacterized protein n=1 Tax=Mugilogobius chulae TaxID=88201 RepID=A0AAW0MPL5_9GOBI
MALIYSIKARDQKTQGNLQLAQECADKAKWYNILAAGWNMLIPLLLIVILVLLLIHLGSTQDPSTSSARTASRTFSNSSAGRRRQKEEVYDDS